MVEGIVGEFESTRDALEDISTSERNHQANLVKRNVDFLIDILAAEQIGHGRYLPAACPHALAAVKSRKREKTGGVFPCSYEDVLRLNEAGSGCACQDPLHGSDDPLDAVAAVILGSSNRSGADRYYDHEWRALVAKLRDRHGQWEDIASLSYDPLEAALDQASSRNGVAEYRTRRLKSAFEYFQFHRYTDGVSLKGLPAVEYTRLADFLADCPGIDPDDAWWLVLTALDKPVWPADPAIDTLLADFGLIDPDELIHVPERRDRVEEIFPERVIPTLHRAMAGHALKADPSYCGDDCEIRKFSLLYRAHCQAETPEGLTVADLFCGAGGLSTGFVTSGFKIAFAIDNDQQATDTYRLNHPEIPHDRVLCNDIENLLKGNESKLPGDVDVVIGGPPCQSLSQAGYRARLASDDTYCILDDPRTHLYQSYVEVVERLDPSILLMENVEGIVNEIGDSEIRVLDQILEALEKIGYVCEARLIDCSEFGIPQQRERVFLLGVKPELAPNEAVVNQIFETLEVKAPEATFTLRDGLAGLPKLRRGEGGNAIPHRAVGRPSEYISRNSLQGKSKITFNHRAREHPMSKDRELFDSVMEPGDTGWGVKYEKGRDDLIEYDVGTEDNPRFIDKYRMIHWDRPAPTVVAHLAKDANNFVIPDYYEYVQPDESRADPRRNRGITPREAARLQSFPDDYLFLGPFTSQFRQIGNAVPPILCQQLSNILKKILAMRRPPPESQRLTEELRTPVTAD